MAQAKWKIGPDGNPVYRNAVERGKTKLNGKHNCANCGVNLYKDPDNKVKVNGILYCSSCAEDIKGE